MKASFWFIPLVALALAACAPQQSAEAPAGATAATPGAAATSDTGAATTPQASMANATPGTSEPAGPTPTLNPTTVALAKNFQVPVRGGQDAPVRIYEFSDYLCPFCRRFETETVPEILKKYTPDQVAMVYWDFPLSGHGVMAVVAAEAAHCTADQGADFWKMHDHLFDQQKTLEEVKPDDEKGAVDMAVKMGQDIGVDTTKLRACLESQIYRPIVGALQQQAMQRGVDLTPTLVVVSKSPTTGQYGDPETVLGYIPLTDLDPYLQRSFSRAQGTVVPTPTPLPTETPGPGTPTAPPEAPAGAPAP